MTADERKNERLLEELAKITFTFSIEEYSPERVIEIVEQLEALSPTSDLELEASEARCLSRLEEIFVQKIEN